MRTAMRKTKVKRLGAGAYHVTGASGLVYWIRELGVSEGVSAKKVWHVGMVRSDGREFPAFDAAATMAAAKRLAE